MRIEAGFQDIERTALAALYWQGFGPKLGPLLGPEARAVGFLAATMDPAHAFVARSADGDVLGLAGFRSAEGGLLRAGWRDLAGHYGVFGALWRGILFWLVRSDEDSGRLIVDGLVVAAGSRRNGIGSRLLEAVAMEARSRRLAALRLDVAVGNDRARALYLRRGFDEVGRLRGGLGASLIGLPESRIMVRHLAR